MVTSNCVNVSGSFPKLPEAFPKGASKVLLRRRSTPSAGLAERIICRMALNRGAAAPYFLISTQPNLCFSKYHIINYMLRRRRLNVCFFLATIWQLVV